MKWIDLPPIWLAACVFCVWGAPAHDAYVPAQWFLGAIIIGAGLVLMGLAVFEMRRHRTTVIPHLQPSNLVTSGIFAISRNPIYLGDALFLLGFNLMVYSHPGLLLLVPVFMWIITHRFIGPEEKRLNDAFERDFIAYCSRTRRWL